ncbi:thermonuclease family protein [Rhodosalinus sediminis]|uniref:thermonuclease family protein n=1 Tax=Rhodosalinus sediminis TaxID=1940533 RepID=UPI001864DE6A|nr:thermonuclease family protein [Rhodosalinus sediminis]
MRALLTLCLLLMVTPLAAAPVGPARVIDGDTLEIGETRVRLHGIDAPEIGQPCRDGGEVRDCGRWAAEALRARVEGRVLRCEARDRDRYGRVVARCEAGGEDVAAALVRAGLAFAYRRYSTDYVDAEARARAAGRGLHRVRIARPEDHRRAARTPQRAQGCAIKGNVARDGERIYHLPGQQFYARTRISERHGERWFCSEAEARAAGWRRARR